MEKYQGSGEHKKEKLLKPKGGCSILQKWGSSLLTLGLFFSTLPGVAAKEASASDAPNGNVQKVLEEFYEKFRTLDAQKMGSWLQNGKVSVLIHLKDATPEDSNFTLRDLEAIQKRQESAHGQIENFVQMTAQTGLRLDVQKEFSLIGPVLKTDLTVGDFTQLLASQAERIDFVEPNLPCYTLPSGREQEVYAHRRSRRSADPEQWKGQGRWVAILDSGFQPEHPSMTLSEEVLQNRARIPNAETMKKILQTLRQKSPQAVLGDWVNAKAPYGFNYADPGKSIVEEDSSSHGTHVTGIAVGNDPKTGFQGQAPEAQVALMRVFKPDEGTRPDIYNQALEDAISLGVDSINMSLGEDNGILLCEDESTRRYLDLAEQKGIVVAIAIGNAGFRNWTALKEAPPAARNPDLSTAGYPGIAAKSLAVASYNSKWIYARTLHSAQSGDLLYTEVPELPLTKDLFDRDLPFLDVGLGGKPGNIVHLEQGKTEKYTEDDFAGKDLQGKVALIHRGQISFRDKIQNAETAGARAVILVNHDDAELGMDLGKGALHIPTLVLSKTNGDQLIAGADPQKPSLYLSLERKKLSNPEGMRISNFSSWGPSLELDLKPEIMAVGGQVLSSVPENETNGGYAEKSGTSMATPQVSGALLRLNQRLDEDQDILPSSGAERAALLKNLLMSTAHPVSVPDQGEALESPRRQGAGLMQVDAALRGQGYAVGLPESTVAASGTQELKAKIQLGTLQTPRIELPFRIYNISKQHRQKYRTRIWVQSSRVQERDEGLLDPDHVQILLKQDGPELEVDPASFVEQKIKLEIPRESWKKQQKDFPNGFYVEGFIRLESENPDDPDLGLPFIGFAPVLHPETASDLDALEKPVVEAEKPGAEWDYVNLPLLEQSVYAFGKIDPEGKAAQRPQFYNLSQGEAATQLVSFDHGHNYTLGEQPSSNKVRKFDRKWIAFSPNGDEVGDRIALRGVFLRPFFKEQVFVYNDQNELVYQSGLMHKDLNKIQKANILDPKFAPMSPQQSLSSQDIHWGWDGRKNDGGKAPEGLYYFEFTAYPAVLHAGRQHYRFPVYLDETQPQLIDPKYEESTHSYRAEIRDPGQKKDQALPGLRRVRLIPLSPQGQELLDSAQELKIEEGKCLIELTKLSAKSDLLNYEVEAEDYAGNRIKLNLDETLRSDQDYAQLEVHFSDLEGGADAGQQGLKIKDTLYHIDVENLEGRIFPNSKKLPEGKYRARLSFLTPAYEVAVGENQKEFEVQKGQTEVSVTFPVRRVQTAQALVQCNYYGTQSFADQAEIYFVNTEHPEKKYKLSLDTGDWSNLSCELPWGSYKLEVQTGENLEWVNQKEIEGKTYSIGAAVPEIHLDFVQKPYGELEVHLQNPDQADLGNLMLMLTSPTGQLIPKELWNRLPEGTYILSYMNCPHTIRISSAYQEVSIRAGQKQVVEWSVRKRTAEDYVALHPEIRMKGGEAPPAHPQFQVKVYGDVETSVPIDRVPKGTMVTVRMVEYDPHYRVKVLSTHFGAPDVAFVDITRGIVGEEPVFEMEKVALNPEEKVRVTLVPNWIQLQTEENARALKSYLQKESGGHLHFEVENIDTHQIWKGDHVLDSEREQDHVNLDLPEGIYDLRAVDLPERILQPRALRVLVTKEQESSAFKTLLLNVSLFYLPEVAPSSQVEVKPVSDSQNFSLQVSISKPLPEKFHVKLEPGFRMKIPNYKGKDRVDLVHYLKEHTPEEKKLLLEPLFDQMEDEKRVDVILYKLSCFNQDNQEVSIPEGYSFYLRGSRLARSVELTDSLREAVLFPLAVPDFKKLGKSDSGRAEAPVRDSGEVRAFVLDERGAVDAYPSSAVLPLGQGDFLIEATTSGYYGFLLEKTVKPEPGTQPKPKPQPVPESRPEPGVQDKPQVPSKFESKSQVVLQTVQSEQERKDIKGVCVLSNQHDLEFKLETSLLGSAYSASSLASSASGTQSQEGESLGNTVVQETKPENPGGKISALKRESKEKVPTQSQTNHLILYICLFVLLLLPALCILFFVLKRSRKNEQK